jgi:hypothetical protein
MLSSIFHAGTFDVQATAVALTAGLLLGLVISIVYLITSDEPGRFAIVIAAMPLLVTAVIMIVNGNLGTSVAVLGAFGLVRFRSAAGSAWEIVFLFFSMAVGLAVGMGFITLAAIITILVGILLILLEKTDYGNGVSKQRELKITIPEDLNYSSLFDDLFQRYTKKAEFRRVKTTNMGTMYELDYRVVLRKPEEEKELIDQIRCRNGNLTVIMGLVEREKNML